jgi:2-methylcitrate dehydratase PrpD
VQIGEVQNRILRFNEASSVPEAKFCLEFCVAVMLAKGKLGLAELAPAVIDSPVIKNLMRKVSRNLVPSAPGDVFAPADSVSITMQDGRRFDSGPIAYAKGSFETPLTKDELFDKFFDCLGSSHDAAKARAIFDTCFGLDDASSIDGLIAAIRAFH